MHDSLRNSRGQPPKFALKLGFLSQTRQAPGVPPFWAGVSGAILLVLGLAPGVRAAPSGQLNDTGQTRCLNAAGTALEACGASNTGNASTRPGQDGRFGRDPAAASPAQSGLTKPAGSGGSGGFAFTPLDVDGREIALTGNPPAPSVTPRCIWDRVTNLIWEVKTDNNPADIQDKDHTYAWRAATPSGSPACGLLLSCNTNNCISIVDDQDICGEVSQNDWRLPTRRELLSIVDHHRSSSPVIDTGYFPNALDNVYWSADGRASDPVSAWVVSFANGDTGASSQTTPRRVRLVRSGQ